MTNPAACVAIEDSQWGLVSARGAGLRCVGVATSYGARELTGADEETALDTLETSGWVVRDACERLGRARP